MSVDKVNVAAKFARISEHWSPRIVGELNGQQVKLAKLKGEFIWHRHEHQDEMFLVLKGTLRMQLRDHEVIINEGEFLIVPHGVEHLPIADNEVQVMLFEPIGTLNTGNVRDAHTIDTPEHL